VDKPCHVQEFAALTGVTVRALHHYDRLGLLQPRRTSSGYRLYGRRELQRLASEDLRLKELVSFTVPANARSKRVMEKLGMTHHPADDIDHPRLPVGHPFRRRVLYRLSLRKQEYIGQRIIQASR
jgi:MerR family regulatory protein/Acetyltransferase (GNAT) domain